MQVKSVIKRVQGGIEADKQDAFKILGQDSIDEHERRPQPAIVSGRVVASAPPDVVESV